jgi:hypothetical protein
MRLALDGLPRDLPLSLAERRQLRKRIRGWKPPLDFRLPRHVPFIPAAVMLVTFFGIAMPATYFTRGHVPWAVLAIVPLQLWLTRRLMAAAMWPYTCRALAENGYEVCPRCAYPLRDADPGTPLCPECGSPRCTSTPSATPE